MRPFLPSLHIASYAFVFMMVSAPAPIQASDATSCTPEQFEGSGYTICTIANPAKLSLAWDQADGTPYRTFSAVAEAMAEDGRQLAFAVNAGMYDTSFRPIGLYVESEQAKVPLNTSEPAPDSRPIPNFLKKPNGVFYVDVEGRAGIETTENYATRSPEARIATQSGPMLVIDGELHPALIPNSTDKTRRSGIGVCEDGVVSVAISDGRVNFHEFARLFRDQLGCSNALFLDGGRGVGLYLPEAGRNDFSWHGGFGPMLTVAD